MPKINLQALHLFILRYRKILVALGFSIIVWTISQTPPTGNLVLMANQFIPANSELSSDFFTQVTISDFDTSNYLSDITEIADSFTTNEIPAGGLVNRENLIREKTYSDRVNVFVNIENQIEIAPGQRLHLWAISEGFSQLISSDALVRLSETDNYGTRLKVSVLASDEYAIMQAQEIKVVLLN